MKKEQIFNKLVDLGIVHKFADEYYIDHDRIDHVFPTSLSFDDVYIQQQKNICSSRLNTEICSEIIRGVRRPIPLIAANMLTVSNPSFCKKLYDLGALGVLHRADDCANLCTAITELAKTCSYVAASVGIGEDQKQLVDKFVRSGANIIFVDIAHGYSENVIDIGRWIKKNYPQVKVVVGNATNLSFIYECADFADAIKVGLANGLACETALTAGCTEGQFTTVFKFREASRELGVPVISDGGVRKPADFVKAIGAGAASVMAGSIFARCPESAAPFVKDVDGKNKKLYAGMASRYVQDVWRGGLKAGTCPEGRVVMLEVGESAADLLERYSGALRSAITYAGVDNITDFMVKTTFGRHA